jgi:hypothetical protein
MTKLAIADPNINKPATNPRGKRKYLRFSLRALLVVMSIVALWLGFRAASVIQQKSATNAIRKAGGYVTYDFQTTNDRFDWNATPPGPAWLRQLIGGDWFDTVTDVELDVDRISVTDAEIASVITSLSHLEKLTVRFPPAGEQTVRAINRLEKLKVLALTGYKITDDDLRYLTNVKTLETLWLTDTQVSNDSVRRLQQALPDCDIHTESRKGLSGPGSPF